MSVRGPTNKFFYDRVHDKMLYYFVLEAHVFDEQKGDFVYTSSGEIKLEGGWGAIAEKMTSTFGRNFTYSSVRDRHTKIVYPLEDNGYIDKLFDEVMSMRDQIEIVTSVMNV